jgi:O-antigen/teichoic acid export membrane protein
MNILKFLYEYDLKKIFIAIVSEGLLSLSNFFLGILVARYAIKSEYGLYVVLFSIIGIIGAYQNALINGPMMVLIHHKNEEEKKIYASSLEKGKNYIFLSAIIVLCTVAICYINYIQATELLSTHIIIVSIVSFIYLSKEYMRTLCFVSMDTNTILSMDILNVCIIFAGMALCIFTTEISAINAIVILGTGYLISYGYAKQKGEWQLEKENIDIRKALSENWDYGKWSMTGVTCSLVQDRGYIYIVTFILGLNALADISAARLFMMPIGLLNLSSTRIAVSKGSKLLSQEKQYEFRIFLFYLIITLLLIWFIYFVFIMYYSDIMINILGEKYANTKNLLIYWGIFFFIYTIRYQLGTGLGVYKKFKEMAKIDLVAATVAILSCITLLSYIDRAGGILSLVLGELVAMILYIRLYKSLNEMKLVTCS